MSVLREILSGTLWVIAARWGIRGIGLVSTLILARLLSPADFGVVAMAMFTVGLIEVFGETGLGFYIIRHPDPQRSDLDTVWTLRLLVGFALAVAMMLLAPAGAAFFHEPKVEAAIRVLALRPLLAGLENPGIILFRRNMVFSKDFEFLVLNKVVSFTATIGLAFILRDYWALVIGIVSGGVASTLQSYRMHPYRPRFDLSETRAAWGFSFWILLQSLLLFLNSRVDELIIGRVKSTALMGYYTLASDIASSPVEEIVAPLGRVLFPGLSRLAHQRKALVVAFEKIMSSVAVICLAVSAGTALVAADVTQVFLGDKWMPVVPLLRILAVSAGILILAQPIYTLFNAIGRPRIAVVLGAVRQVMLVAAMLPAAIYYDLTAVAMARTGVAMAAFVLTVLVYATTLKVPMARLWANLVRPIASVLAMCGVVFLVQHVSPDQPIIRLALSVCSGAASYAATLLILWWAAGRPDGVEGDLVAMAVSRIRSGYGRVPWFARQRRTGGA